MKSLLNSLNRMRKKVFGSVRLWLKAKQCRTVASMGMLAIENCRMSGLRAVSADNKHTNVDTMC